MPPVLFLSGHSLGLLLERRHDLWTTPEHLNVPGVPLGRAVASTLGTLPRHLRLGRVRDDLGAEGQGPQFLQHGAGDLPYVRTAPRELHASTSPTVAAAARSFR